MCSRCISPSPPQLYSTFHCLSKQPADSPSGNTRPRGIEMITDREHGIPKKKKASATLLLHRPSGGAARAGGLALFPGTFPWRNRNLPTRNHPYYITTGRVCQYPIFKGSGAHGIRTRNCRFRVGRVCQLHQRPTALIISDLSRLDKSRWSGLFTKRQRCPGGI